MLCVYHERFSFFFWSCLILSTPSAGKSSLKKSFRASDEATNVPKLLDAWSFVAARFSVSLSLDSTTRRNRQGKWRRKESSSRGFFLLKHSELDFNEVKAISWPKNVSLWCTRTCEKKLKQDWRGDEREGGRRKAHKEQNTLVEKPPRGGRRRQSTLIGRKP